MRNIFACFGDVLPKDTPTASSMRDDKLSIAMRRIQNEHVNRYLDEIIDKLATLILSTEGVHVYKFTVPDESAKIVGVVSLLIENIRSEVGDRIDIFLDTDNTVIEFAIRR